MTIKDDLLRAGYLPDNLPPTFHTGEIAQYFAAHPPNGYLGGTFRAANYSASKRGLSRRSFSLVHPATAHDLAEFIGARQAPIFEFLEQNTLSVSQPMHTPDSDRAVRITSHAELDTIKYECLSRHRFIARTDISRFYHSIYTHSLPWAFHGKGPSKADRSLNSANIYFNRLDTIFRQGQDGQTIGIPVGPDASRIIAEVLNGAIDRDFQQRLNLDGITVLRHVDDVWFGADTYSEAEQALWKYREALREFELDINENKTRIYSEGFRFVEEWPTEIAAKIEFAHASPEPKRPERLRAALEYAFNLAASEGDDGVLRFAIRYVDESPQHWTSWPTLNAFLKRVAAHFGHAIDYVVRVIVWRQLTSEDLDVDAWRPILLSALRQHSRLGNDSEVCWIAYACLRLGIVIPGDTGGQIVESCGALSIVSLLNCASTGLLEVDPFPATLELVRQENANGPYWPVFLEWLSRGWHEHQEVRGLADCELLVHMADHGVKMFSPERLPPVFEGVAPDDFRNILSAIERGGSFYDDDEITADDFDDLDGEDDPPADGEALQ